MKKFLAVLLMFLLVVTVSFAIKGYGPGDGIPDGPDDGAGYGSPGTGTGEGPGKGKFENNTLTEDFEILETDMQEEKEEEMPFTWMRKIAEMFRNMFKRMLSQSTA
ncbi:MAG: hypothetical protein R6U52_08215 [Kosmotogaceae bacterium]